MMQKPRVLALAVWASFSWAGAALAQDSPAAASARQRIQQKISVEFKDVTTKAIFEDIKSEMDKPVSFKIDTTTGLSLNTKLSYKASAKTVEQILNEMADKFEFGWFVKSDPKDRYDGWVIIRKHKNKERGYEDGKEPAKKAAAPTEGAIRFTEHAALLDPNLDPVVKRALLWLARTRSSD